MKSEDLALVDVHRERERTPDTRPLPARLALSAARDRAAAVLCRMADGLEQADLGRVAAARAVLELGEHRGR